MDQMFCELHLSRNLVTCADWSELWLNEGGILGCRTVGEWNILLHSSQFLTLRFVLFVLTVQNYSFEHVELLPAYVGVIKNH